MSLRRVIQNITKFQNYQQQRALLKFTKNQCHNNNKRSISSAHGVPESERIKNPTSGFIYSTLGELLENAADKSGDKIAIHSQHQQLSITYKKFNHDVDRLACALHRIGIGHSDPVGIWAVNSYEWILVQFATAKLGATLITINPGYREQEFLNCLNLVKLKTLICNQSFKNSNYVEILQNVSSSLLENAHGHSVRCPE